MLDVSAPEAMLRVLVLSIPVFILATLAVLARSKWRRRGSRGDPRMGIASIPEQSHTSHSNDQKAEPETMLTDPLVDTLERNIEDRIRAAEANRQTSELAALYLELGRQRQAENRPKEAIAALGSAAAVAAKFGPKSVHAEARLELAEWAYKTGDLTTACEHWQIARSALQDDGQTKASARIDQIMRENGCPTDWVLTDF